MVESPGIYNVHDYKVLPTNDGATNASNLQAMIATVQDAGGGIILIPSNTAKCKGGTYYFATPNGQDVAVEITKPESVVFVGIGSATKLVMTDDHDLFHIKTNPTGANDVGGITFQDIQIEYQMGSTSGAGIHIVQGQDVRFFRVAFVDCPVGAYLEYCLQLSMLECTVTYDQNVGTGIIVGSDTVIGNIGIEIYVSACQFSVESSAVSAGSVGMLIRGAEHFRVANTRIDSFEQGIIIAPTFTSPEQLSGSVRKLYFNNVSVFTTGTSSNVGAAVLFQPAAGRPVTQAVFVACEFAPASGGTSYQGAGVYVNGMGAEGSPAVIDQVRFVSCRSTGWPGAGLEISAGSDIEIVGGCYCDNGSDSGATFRNGIVVYSPALELVPATTGLRIVGVACNNSTTSPPGTQVYGVSLSGAENVCIRDCDLDGNTSGALSVEALFARNVQVTNCTGYNDKGTVLASAPLGDGATIKNTSLPTPYYGPIAFYVSEDASVAIQIDGQAIPLQSGGFTLNPGESAVMNYSGTPTFWVVGK